MHRTTNSFFCKKKKKKKVRKNLELKQMKIIAVCTQLKQLRKKARLKKKISLERETNP